MSDCENNIKGLREDLINDCYAAAIIGGIGPAILEIPDIERMNDEEVVKEAKRRGFI